MIDPDAKLKLVYYEDPLLKKLVPRYDFREDDVDIRERLEQGLKQHQYSISGWGLSAIQVGVPVNLFVMGVEEPYQYCCWNAEILEASEKKVLIEEGCLSRPNYFVKIHRPEWVMVRFADNKGVFSDHKFEGLSARVFQHELDHQFGVLFTDHAHWIHTERALKKEKKLNRTLRNNMKAQRSENDSANRSSEKRIRDYENKREEGVSGGLGCDQPEVVETSE